MCRRIPSRIEPTIPWPPRPTGVPQVDAAAMAHWRAEKQRIEQESEQQEKQREKRRDVLLVVVLAAFCACGVWLSGRREAAKEQRLIDLEQRLEVLEDSCPPTGGWL